MKPARLWLSAVVKKTQSLFVCRANAKPRNFRRYLLLLAVTAWCSGLVQADFGGHEVETPDAITWPMLPGDSLNRLAALFYPANKHMQRRFVARTLELSHEFNPDLNPAQIFTQPGTLIIPELKALSLQAKPYKAHKRHYAKALKLRLSYKIGEEVTPEMHAQYENLRKRDQVLKQDLERLNLRLSELQLHLDQLKLAAESQPVQKETAVSTPVRAPAPQVPPTSPTPAKMPVLAAENQVAQKQLAAPTPVSAPAPEVPPVSPLPAKMPVLPTHKPVESKEALLDSAWALLLAEFLLLVIGLILAIAAWHWVRKRLAKNLEETTNKQMDAMHKNALDKINAPVFDLSKTDMDDYVDPGILSVEEIESVVEEARIFISMGRVNEAKSLLVSYIEELPKAALPPWLYLMDIYRSEKQKDEFMALAKRFHLTFNVMAPLWEEVKVAMVVANSLEEFPHIVSQLVSKWAAGEAKPYLDELLSDNRDGERAGFSLEVLEEIMMLQGLLEIRDEISV